MLSRRATHFTPYLPTSLHPEDITVYRLGGRHTAYSSVLDVTKMSSNPHLGANDLLGRSIYTQPRHPANETADEQLGVEHGLTPSGLGLWYEDLENSTQMRLEGQAKTL